MIMERQYWICSCYFSRNIFLRHHRLHVSFQNERQFLDQYKAILAEKGCDTDEKIQDVLTEVKAEIGRRKNRGKDHIRRSQLIAEKYEPLHAAVYTLSESFLNPSFLEIVRYCKSPGSSADRLLDFITEENPPNTFSFPMFTAAFCKQLVEELDHFEHSDIPKGRPNTMNNSGILLSELGYDEGFIDSLRLDYLMPIAHLLYPKWVGRGLDSHRAFVVQYSVGEDVDLSYHFDNAEVTLNVCLGKSFVGGKLYFGPVKGQEEVALQDSHVYEHSVGRGLLHRARHMHGALPITKGERYNLIIWMRSSTVRNQLCPMCDHPPELIKNEGYGDGFTQDVINACDIV